MLTAADRATASTVPPRGWEAPAMVALLGLTALLYLWNLSASGWANGFYSAAAQAGAANPTAFLFGSSDAGNAITVDKTPAALWVMSSSVRLFGLNSWSLLVPQALMGVAAVGVLYAAVRRTSGPVAGLIAGTVFALTPVAALMFRYNNPDALLTLLLVVAAYGVLRALAADAGRWWLPLAGTALGLAFLAKMLQAFLVVPVFAMVYLATADAPLGIRLRRLLGGLAALIGSAGWYLLLVEVWPAGSRPYIGGSQQNSILELTLGYNGLGRLTGDEVGGLGNTNFDVGAGRLFGPAMGGQIGWLLPAALIALTATLWITRRAPRVDPIRAAMLLWGGWLVLTGAVFSYANGIVHSYYTVALAPPIGATIGIGVVALWVRRNDIRAAAALAMMVAVTAVWGYLLLQRYPGWQPWLRVVLAVIGAAVAVLMFGVGRLTAGAGRALAVLALAVGLAGPGSFTLATVATGHHGALPSAGPPGRLHGPHPDHGPHPPDRGPRLPDGGPPLAGLLDIPDPGPELIAALRHEAHAYTWVAATIGSNNAAGYQLAAGAPVMALGGFNGTDPAPTLAQFEEYVAAGRIHFFLGGPSTAPGRSRGSDQADRIAAWVAAHFPAQTINGVRVYDLTPAFIAGA